MKTVIKGIVHTDMNTGDFTLFSSDMSKYDYVVVGPASFEYDVPADFNPVLAQVTALEKKLDTLSEEYQRNVAAIRGQISNLQCIENSPGAAS
jgi:hypothetical protein